MSREATDFKILWKSPAEPCLWLAALALIALHYTMTGPLEFANDAGGHLEYIELLRQNWLPPKPYACWECHQPPLYYYPAALAYVFGNWIRLFDPADAARLLSLIFHCAFLAYGAKFLRETISNHTHYLAALALLLLWPIHIMRATQLSNDPPLAMAMMASFYYLARWWRTKENPALAYSIACAGLAVAFKNSGLIMFGGIGACLLIRERRRFLRVLTNRRTATAVFASAIVVCLVFGRLFYYYRVEEKRTEPLMVPAAAQLGPEIKLSNDSWRYYLRFDFKSYVTEPFLFHGDNEPAHYFWNNFLKSAVLGEFHWKGRGIALALSIVQLAMIFYLAAAALEALVRKTGAARDYLPHLLFIGLQIASLIAFRMQYPFSCHQDLRFIAAIMGPLIGFYGLAIGWHHARGRKAACAFGIALAMLMCALSAALFLAEHVF